jgi:O-methyltransferase involved in polyketide biosynthesis
MNIDIGDVASTLFVTLYCHAIESQSKDSILNDPKAVEITQELNKILCNSNIKLERELTEGKIDKRQVVHLAIRAKQYDKIVGKFLESSPEGVVVNIA